MIVATKVSFANSANSLELKMTRLATRLAESCRRKIKRGFLRHGNDTSKYFFSLTLASRIKLHIVLDIMVAVFKETIERDLSRIRNTELHNHVSEMRIFNVSSQNFISFRLIRRVPDELHLFDQLHVLTEKIGETVVFVSRSFPLFKNNIQVEFGPSIAEIEVLSATAVLRQSSSGFLLKS